jgi:hypothetical protein
MDAQTGLATLARQIESAKALMEVQGRRPNGVDAAVLRTLRVTYLALSAGLSPWLDGKDLFTLRVTPPGDYSLAQGGLAVPVNSPYLAYLFWTAGVELPIGQVLYLDAELAKDAIEEALGVLALEQACTERERLEQRDDPEALWRLVVRAKLLWERKTELVAASLLAEEYMERSRALAGTEEADRMEVSP